MRMAPRHRLLLLAMALLAAYQVAIGVDHLSALPMLAYTIAFGVLIIAGILLVILGFDALESPAVVVASTVIPLALSIGLVEQHLAPFRDAYLAFAAAGFAAVIATRTFRIRKGLATLVLALVHGVAGLVIFLLPPILSLAGKTGPAFSLIGAGGALIGLGGLLLASLRAGKPVLARETILNILPGLLLVMTICFVAGFSFG